MNLARWPELEAHFDQAVTMPPAQRARYLADLATQPELQTALLGLLAAADAPDPALGRPAVDALRANKPAAPALIGQRVGAWRLLEWVGAGGMGEVYRAERADGRYEQVVAVKLLRADALDSLQRFEMERRILAQLEHPGIARLYDAGVTDDGRPYIVMEWVDGIDLVSWCTQQAADLPARLALFLQICEAVSWAHRHLLVHRDIKPANVLVTEEGRAKLLDFGIAKHLSGHGTQTINAPLTPAYAAPEQLSGEPITTATDVYALGVMLFQLLTGRLPWSGDGASLPMMFKRLMETPAPAPSRVVAADSPVPRRALRGDLDAIVGRALRQEPAARYADARELADDIRRYQERLPVQARAGARSYVLRRYLRRHWLAFATAAVVFAAMTVALVAITREARKARIEAQRAAAVQSFMVELFRTNSSNQPDPVKARQTTARELLDIGAKRIHTELNSAPENKLALLRLFGDLYRDFALTQDEMPLRQQAVDLSRRLYGQNSPELAGDLLQQAWVTVDLDADAAAREIDEARAILDRRHDDDSFLRGRLLASSAANDSASDMVRARNEAAQAVAILSRYPDSFELVDALYTQAIAEAASGRYLDAMPPLQRAIDMLVRVKGPYAPELAFYYLRMASIAGLMKSHDVAIASAQKAIDLARAKGSEHDYDWVRAQSAMAEALVGAERPRDALASVARAKAAAPPASPSDAELRNYVHLAAARALVRAGDPETGLADADTALVEVRAQQRDDAFLALTLEFRAEVLEELGKTDEAERALDDSARIYQRIGALPREWPAILRIHMALATGRITAARAAFAALPPVSGEGLEATAKNIRRRLTAAEIDLAEGHPQDAAQHAADIAARARASTLAPYLRLTITEGELIEGLARLRSGDAPAACPLLSQVLATRSELLLPKSPKIAEAQLALAECERASGRRKEAAALIEQAAAIQAQHPALSERYREPLMRLRAQH
ncbi:MAG: serine/threonine-protein kinase [Hydrocarboniphaga sp.]|uniref:serine/threonine-protein kinase n=1 Tax=Hydrocarboniphaga sp. TaxID=2033016 RepID=UPI0026151704|nr:serine/threonine-protein kinase [Hydrocarboniphaga sp.]MDB5967552.1 serine/threonine-protein kinase [Hydrocarboniphaga sp.]